MLVKKYPAEVVEIQNPVDTLYVLKLRSKEKPFKFLPGQFLHLAIDDYDPSAGWPESRCFSIHGWDETRSDYTHILHKGPLHVTDGQGARAGENPLVKMPYGSLFQDIPDKTGCIFIAGGTGITPFLSLFTDKSFENFDNPKLYAGFRSKPYIYMKDTCPGQKMLTINLSII